MEGLLSNRFGLGTGFDVGIGHYHLQIVPEIDFGAGTGLHVLQIVLAIVTGFGIVLHVFQHLKQIHVSVQHLLDLHELLLILDVHERKVTVCRFGLGIGFDVEIGHHHLRSGLEIGSDAALELHVLLFVLGTGSGVGIGPRGLRIVPGTVTGFGIVLLVCQHLMLIRANVQHRLDLHGLLLILDVHERKVIFCRTVPGIVTGFVFEHHLNQLNLQHSHSQLRHI